VNPDSIGGTFGFIRSGNNTGDGRFDNLTVTPPAFVAGQVASHTFATNTANTAAFTAANPEFTFSGAGGAATSGGQLTMNNPGGGGFSQVTRSGFLGEMIVTAKVGAVNSNGNYNVGLNIGGHNIVFHPGLAGGAFRVEGANGFGNTTMNFTPANGVLHDMVVHIFDNGLFDISVIDGNNPQNIFHASFVDVSWSGLTAAQRDVGFRVDGPNGAGLFDDLNIYQVVATPEPTTIAMWACLGVVGLCWKTLRGRKRSAT
jgi:hypothetical protein